MQYFTPQHLFNVSENEVYVTPFMTIIVFNHLKLFYYPSNSFLGGMKYVFKHQDL